MSSNTLTIKDFLGKSDYRNLSVPQYQRDYSWEQKQFEELWSDIQDIGVDTTREGELTVKNSHFLGLLVLISSEMGNNTDIVDGQQRLTTIFILLNSLRDYFLYLSKTLEDTTLVNRATNRVNHINNLIYQDTALDKIKKKLNPNSNDKAFFDDVMYFLNGESIEPGDTRTSKYISSPTQSPFILKEEYMRSRYDNRVLKGKSAIKAYNFFYREIEALINPKLPNGESVVIPESEKIKILEELKLKIESGLILMVFDSKNESDAFNLFETLNDRGLALASIDLIKNKILKSVPEVDRTDASRSWDEIFGTKGTLFSINTNSFLRYFYIIEDEYITKTELYDKWKKKIEKTKQSDIQGLINRIHDVAVNYKFLIDPDSKSDSQELNLLILLLRKSNSIQWYSVGLPLIEMWNKKQITIEEKKAIIDIFWLLVNITLRFILNETRFNILEKKFPVIGQGLIKRNIVSFKQTEKNQAYTILGRFDSDLDGLIHTQALLNDIIDTHVPDLNDTTSIDISGVDFENNNTAVIILRLLLNERLPHGTYIDDKITLEHVLPIKHKPNWASHDDFADSVKFKLGNMLLLSRELNASISNASYIDKVKEYKALNVIDISINELSYSSINNQIDWSETLIMGRTSHLALKFSSLLKKRNF